MTPGLNERADVLSLGSVVGGGTAANQPWRTAIRELTVRISTSAEGARAPLKLNVVFHVPGNLAKPEFEGVRSGRFSKPRSLLMIQVALPVEVPADPASYVRAALYAAIEEAERWAAKRGVHADASELRRIVDGA